MRWSQGKRGQIYFPTFLSLPGLRVSTRLSFSPNVTNGDKDRGKEPKCSKAECPWFWGWDEKTEDFMSGKDFEGNRHNACHYTIKAKQAASDAAGRGKSVVDVGSVECFNVRNNDLFF